MKRLIIKVLRDNGPIANSARFQFRTRLIRHGNLVAEPEPALRYSHDTRPMGTHRRARGRVGGYRDENWRLEDESYVFA
jgi:hypothetical protein